MNYKYINNFKFNSTFIKTFILLILLSIILLTISSYIFYSNIIDILKEQTCNTNLSMLRKTKENHEQLLLHIYQRILDLSYDSNVINALIVPDANKHTRNYAILSELRNIVSTNESIDSIYLFVPYRKTLFSSDGNIYNADNFYDGGWEDIKSSYNKENIIFSLRKGKNNNFNNANYLTFCLDIPYNSITKMGKIVVNLNTKKLYNSITEVDINKIGESYVLSNNGQILLTNEEEKLGDKVNNTSYIQKIIDKKEGYFTEVLDNNVMLFFYTSMERSNMKYVHTIPVDFLGKDTSIIFELIISTLIICLIISLILTYFITRNMYQPVNNLMNIVSKNKNYLENNLKNEYEYLTYAYSQIITKNEDLNTIINNTKPIIKEKLFINLLNDKRMSLEEIKQKLYFLELEFDLKNYTVMVIQIENYSQLIKRCNEAERNLLKISLAQKAEELVEKTFKALCIEVEVDKLALIVNSQNDISYIETRKKAINYAEKIYKYVKENYSYSVSVGIGRVYENIQDISHSYDEAIEALDYKLYLKKDKIFDIENIEFNNLDEVFYFCSEKEKILINNIILGEEKDLKKIIIEYFEDIQSSGKISYNLLQKILNKTISSIIEMIISVGMSTEEIFKNKKDIYFEFTHNETIQEIINRFELTCLMITESVRNNNNEKQYKYIENIKHYIEKNYSKDISLNDAANYVGLNSAYFSKFFKDHLGKNFIDYVNRTRIEKAKQLLSKTQLSAKEVGFKTGFNTIQNFMRVFKKYEGITPGQYRDMI